MINKSRTRKSPLRKRSMRKSRARKSPIRKRSVRKSTRRKSHSRVGKSVRHKSAHKSPRKSVRYKYSPSKALPPKNRYKIPSFREEEEEEFKKWVKENLENKKLYRCIRLDELESIQSKKYMSSLSINKRQDVSVAKWIIHGIPSQYSSTGKFYTDLINHSFCSEDPKKKRKISDNTKENPICMIRIDLSKLDKDKYEIIIPSIYQDIMEKGKKVGKVKRVEHKIINEEVYGNVYTEFADKGDETKGINVYDYYTEIDENGNHVEKRDLKKHTTDTVYLYPAFPIRDGLNTTHQLINRWTSGLTLNRWDNMKWSASQTVGEVVFCGKIPSEALTVVAERKNKTMISLKNPVTIEEYKPPDRPPPKRAKRSSSDKAILSTSSSSVDKMATSLDTDHPLDSDDKMDTSLTDSRKRKPNDDDNTDLSGIMPRKIVKTSEYVDIYDAEGNKLGTTNKDGKYFTKYLNDKVIKLQKVNGVDKYVVVVVDHNHDIYDKIAKQKRRLETKSV